MKIAIVGGGIIGITSAYYLCKAGHEVSIIDKENDISQMASNANGAQLSYSYTEPLGSPALLHDIPEILLGKSTGIKIDNYWDKKLWSWGIKLLLNCSHDKYIKNKEAILKLSLASRKLMTEMLEEHDFNFEYKKNGKLFIFENKKNWEKFKSGIDYLKNHDITHKAISKSECLELEPVLTNRKGDIVGGILSPNDAVGDTYKLCKEIQNYLMDKYSLSIHLNADVNDIITNGNKIEYIKSNNMNINADAYLICGGAFSGNILRKLSIKDKIYPIKGYSIRIKNSDKYRLNHNMTDYNKKLVLAPLDSHLRISGMMRFAGVDNRVKQSDIEYMITATKQIIPSLDFSNMEVHAGLRPYTPNSTPQIGKAKYKNMFLNIGHGMFGWTLSLGSGKKISEIISNSNIN